MRGKRKGSLKELDKWQKVRKQEYLERRTQDICEKCDVELERIKNNRPLSITSQYRKNYSNDIHPLTSGFSRRVTDDPDSAGSISDWMEAFEYFKNKTVNIYGQKVNRKKVFDENYSFGNAQVKKD